MKTPHHEALEVCLAALNAGVDLDECISQYPDLAAELRPLLESAIVARELAARDVPVEAITRSRKRMLARAAQLRAERRSRPRLRMLPRLAYTALAIAAVVLLGGTGLFIASAQSLPGDFLYLVKRVAEGISIDLTAGVDPRRSLEVGYGQRRVDEVRELFRLGRVEQVTFDGIVTSQSPPYWIVEDIPVIVTSQTEIIGEIEVGLRIKVEGETQPEGWVLGHKILLKYFELIGWVEVITPEIWVISGVELYLTDNATIDTGILVGDHIIAIVEADSDGRLYIIDIKRLISPTSQPTQIPAPIVSPTPSLTPIPDDGDDDDGFEVKFTGIVEVIGDDTWVIGGQTVSITVETTIDDGIVVGDIVEVEALVNESGIVTALEIELIEDDGDDMGDDGDENDDGDNGGDDGDDDDGDDDDGDGDD